MSFFKKIFTKKAPEPEEKIPAPSSLLDRLKTGLQKTRQRLGSGLAALFLGRKNLDESLLEDIETLLLGADVGVEVAERMVALLTQALSRQELKDVDSVKQALKAQLLQILRSVEKPLQISDSNPFVILMIGVNGAGKTTSIGKLAHRLRQEGKSVLLAAGDTFRAAAVEQLKIWGDRNQVPVIAQEPGADSASVIFDAFQAAKARKIEVVIADTAGRLQNKAHLMEELLKVKRVISKLDPQAPHEVMLVLDAGNGQNALMQAVQFHQSLGVTGITVTKLDGTAKGGILFAIAEKLKLPIRFIGVGESLEDLQEFKAEAFVSSLFDD